MSDDAQHNPLKGWHFRKEFHAGHVITTLGFLIAAVLAWSRLEQMASDHERRLAVIERRAEDDDTPARLARIEALLEILVNEREREP